MSGAYYDGEALRGRIGDYEHKAKVLRQIHSNKLAKATRRNAALNYSMVVVSSLVTFFTFFGIENIYGMFLSNIVDVKRLNFAFGLLLLALLIASFLQITLRLGEQALGHLGSVRALTDFITDLDDLKLQKNLTPDQCDRHIERLNERYKSITHVLPANSDSEWRKGKKKLGLKDRG
jgi:hypothetical protein